MFTSGGDRHRVAVVVLEDTLALDVAIAVQAFGPRPTAFDAIRHEPFPPYELVVCGDPDGAISSPGFALAALGGLDTLEHADTIVVPGVNHPERPRHALTLEALASAADRGARLVSLCTGAFVLGHAGALKGHRVTTHWALADEFRRCFPDVHLDDDALYIDDGQVLSSGGMLAATDLCLHVLRNDRGGTYANDVARLLVSPPHRNGGQGQYRTSRDQLAPGSLEPLMRWALDNLSQDLDLQSLAAKANLSSRTLSRRFEVEAGTTAAAWITDRRVDRARALLETTDLTVTDIAFACGFGSLATFRRQFSRSIGTTPRRYRQTFQRAPGASTA